VVIGLDPSKNLVSSSRAIKLSSLLQFQTVSRISHEWPTVGKFSLRLTPEARLRPNHSSLCCHAMHAGNGK
jgi:hypothetical protein